jgi:hypothetical protein
MKNALILVVGALVGLWILSGCSVITGSGVLKTEQREVSGFTQVEADGPMDVTFKPGDVEGVTIEADDNILPVLETYVSNGVLHLKIKDLTAINHATIHMTVTYTTLDNIVLNGPASGEALEISQQKLSTVLNGPSSLTLAGVTNALTINLNGPGSLAAFALTAQDTSATLSGPASAQINVEKTLTAALSGPSTLTYRGDPAVTQTLSGPATLQKAQ